MKFPLFARTIGAGQCQLHGTRRKHMRGLASFAHSTNKEPKVVGLAGCEPHGHVPPSISATDPGKQNNKIGSVSTINTRDCSVGLACSSKEDSVISEQHMWFVGRDKNET